MGLFIVANALQLLRLESGNLGQTQRVIQEPLCFHYFFFQKKIDNLGIKYWRNDSFYFLETNSLFYVAKKITDEKQSM